MTENKTNIPFVDLHSQYQSIKKEIDTAMSGVVSDSAYIGGKYVSEFEQSFASYIGRKHCISCGNGTDAIEIILRVMGIGHGDEVIVPANSFIATSEAVSAVGARPVFVDSDPDRYTIDLTKIEQKISPRTKAIIPVHLYGLPAEMDEILDIARKHHLKVIEDAAQAHGARYKGRLAGSMGDAATFSFYPGKNLGAYGDGGAIVLDNEELALRARMIANHGRVKKYDHAIEGRNSRLDGLQAAILNVKLKYLNDWVAGRNRHANAYTAILSSKGLQVPRTPDYSLHAYHLYIVRVEGRENIQARMKSEGIDTGIHYPIPLPLLEAYRAYRHTPADFPVCSTQMNQILSLPMFPELTQGQIERVCEVLIDSLD